jgi:sulfhydrogenase subunit beta (sulfur reductase)
MDQLREIVPQNTCALSLSGFGMFVFQAKDLDRLLQSLIHRGYTVIGPTLRDGAIVHDTLRGAGDLPVGWRDKQDAATYRLHHTGDGEFFHYTVGPIAWKKFLYPPRVRLFSMSRSGKSFSVSPNGEHMETPRYAFVGVRPCDLSAISLLDRIFLAGPYDDPGYRERRRQVFLIAVNCAEPGATCFCGSMGTGPFAERGYDLAITEVCGDDDHYFTVEVGSPAGAEVLEDVPHREATERDRQRAASFRETAAAHMGRSLETGSLKEVLQDRLEDPLWDEVAQRCLTCANCTMVCPTCFCTTVEDRTDLTGEHAERWRRWDSCFTMDFARVAGGNFRSSTRARYRQWLTHKLASWVDQFDAFGCVGCGRCITWCPVGIDITAEAAALLRTIPASASIQGR